MHVMPMSGKCQNYLVNLHFTNICRYHIKYIRKIDLNITWYRVPKQSEFDQKIRQIEVRFTM